MNLIDQAIIFAAKAHMGQTRKSSDIPYITHPFSVGMLLQKENCSEQVIAAGILHDTLEDTAATYEQLKEHFGIRVANLVLAASEQDKSLSWEERKKHTIDSLKDAALEEIQVITADKLHNLLTIHFDLDTIGEAVWDRFKRGKTEQHWYYASMVRELMIHQNEFKLILELKKEVIKVFGSMDVPY
ncbi:HD domain-containing protein [Niallia endozanthoxylica]|uniref:HD domain-containing protein n=1 Tax=Niallia endozanthoxylica TaxID=2036016 RepID=A0A5J5HG56_9BACI|nr:HD domain-containing protein [Niallia endozanthoxylica]KAA9019545.1 HD domain-containing protein [Niallia endozanthoxylica]